MSTDDLAAENLPLAAACEACGAVPPSSARCAMCAAVEVVREYLGGVVVASITGLQREPLVSKGCVRDRC